MKKTYNRTLFIPDLTKATVKLYITEGVKWENPGEEREIEYKNVKAWDIIEGGSEAEEIESMTDEASADECHEYLVLHFADGSTATFRNSHVDMFIR